MSKIRPNKEQDGAVRDVEMMMISKNLSQEFDEQDEEDLENVDNNL